MSEFTYRNGELFVEDVPLNDIASTHGTPAYVYSRKAIVDAYREFAGARSAHKLTVCYAIKANSNLGVLDCLAREGAGFDIVSGGELARVLAAGGTGESIVFSGVGKSHDEIRMALEAGVRCFNVESEPELHRISDIAAQMRRVASISIRVNPDVDAGTHPYISTGLRENKFGIAHEQAVRVYQIAAQLPGIKISGIDCHIGSQITELAPFLAALDKLIELIRTLATHNIELDHIDLGGGLGIPYEGESVPARSSLIEAISNRLIEQLGDESTRYELMFEFGRSMVAGAGVLLTRVEYLKPTEAKNFAIVDAAMNDLLRPSLYDAFHRVDPVKSGQANTDSQAKTKTLIWDLVGPVCESGDWLAKNCELALAEGDLLAIANTGAYGMVMASNYNSRTRPVELMVDGATVHVVRERESVQSLMSGESRLTG
ncbi:MAG: diaminopimelate decarboxylase [Burkholderiaceae bacterium]